MNQTVIGSKGAERQPAGPAIVRTSTAAIPSRELGLPQAEAGGSLFSSLLERASTWVEGLGTAGVAYSPRDRPEEVFV